MRSFTEVGNNIFANVRNASASGRSALRDCVGEIVGTNVWRKSSFLGALLAAVCLLSLSGCGSSSGANVVTVTISSSVGNTIILGQSTTLTATVSGSTNLNVNWENQPCQYTTTTVSGTTSTTSKPIACPTDGSFGTLTNVQTTGTATYTAPTTIPDQTKFPGLQLIFTAQSQADTGKTGTITIILDSGISVVLNLTSATVPTNEQQQFFVTLTNDLKAKSVTWLVTQSTPTSTIPYPSLATCSPGCGTITPDSNNANLAVYTAPSTIPTSTTVTSTPAILTIVATSVSDNTRFALGSITIIQGGPITFNGISPTIAPQGAAFWDIYLDAPNMSSASKITLFFQDSANPNNFIGSKTYDASFGQIKVLFPIPTTTVTNPASTGARLRLFASDLVIPLATGTASVYVSVTDPGQTVTPLPPTKPVLTANPYTFQILPVRPTSVASFPDDVVQGFAGQDVRVVIDGGYFGDSGNFAKVFLGAGANTLARDSNNPSTARQLDTLINSSQINAGSPGLYPLYVAYTAGQGIPAPSAKNPSVTHLAVFPDYSANPPQLLTNATPPLTPVPPTTAGINPSAVDIDPTLGILAVAETGSNLVQFFGIGPASLTPMACPVVSCAVNLPTGLSINRSNHTVAVVSFKDQTVQVFPLPGTTAPAGVPFATPLSLTTFLGSVTPAPIPYSIGVDPDTNMAMVAFSSTSVSSAANLGFVVNLNAVNNPPFGCLDPTVTAGPCIFSQVTMNNGAYPQIAMAPHGHLALVTPGGSGVVRGVDVTKPSSGNVILSATLTASLVTITIDTTKCPPPLANPTSTSNPCPFSLLPGNAGDVLIQGVSKGANGTNFNGVFPVSVTSDSTFTYVINSTVNDSGSGGTAFYSSPDLIFSVSSTAQGVAINPITQVAALADANATGQNGAQIDLLDGIDQSVSSIVFHATCTAYTISCSNAPELLSTAAVAWQPYSNALVSYNPQQQLVSVSDPVSHARYAIVTGLGPGGIQIPITNGTTNTLTLWGGVVVDPATNQAFVVESGQAATSTTPAKPGQIEIINLGPALVNNLKPTQITELLVPSPAPGPGIIGGIPKALLPQGTLTCVAQPPKLPASCDLPNVRIFGSGFSSSAQVHLDGVDITTQGGTVSYVASSGGREVDVKIPSFFLSAPHHYALDVFSSGAQSNAVDFIVVQALDLSNVCPGTNAQPSAVTIADQVANGPFSPIALVTVSGCNSVVMVDINPANATFGQMLGNPIVTGTTPQGVAIYQRRGLAVVTNNVSNNATIIDLKTNPPAPLATISPVGTGTGPAGVAVNEATGAAIIANTGSNTVTMLDLESLFPPSGTTAPTSLTPVSIGGIQQPLAVAIDPDRGTNFQGIAVVSALSLSNGSAATGSLAVVDIGLATPSLSTTISSGFVNAAPTGIVFDPIAATGTQSQGLFYANSSGTNTISTFNPDSGGSNAISVGINPTSLAINPQTGAILTANSASNTISIVDTLGSPLRTIQTLGLPGSPLFGVAIDQFTNLAVIVDQANQRILLFPMPN
jgi:DNA-binding beta-propeller fold protein YncE